MHAVRADVFLSFATTHPTAAIKKMEEDNKSMNKAEKKARKELVKLGLKPVENVHTVTMKKAPATIFTIANPEVFKSSGGGVETYVVYGQCTIDDGSSRGARPSRARAQPSAVAAKPAAAPAAAAPAAEESNGDDLDGLNEKDVQMVISQVGVDRAKAIATLKKNGGDIINSIMDLTM